MRGRGECRRWVLPLVYLGLIAVVGTPVRAAADTAAPLGADASSDTRAYLLYLQADLARKQGNLDQAGSLFEQAVAADPRSPSLLTKLAQVRLEQGREALADELLRRALAIAPDHVPALMALAAVATRRGNRGEAIEHARTAAGLAPLDEGVHLVLSALLTEAERDEEARQVLVGLIDRVPGSFRGLTLLGRLHQSRGETAPALEYLQRATRLEPGQPEAWVLLGKVQEQARNDEQAVSAYRKALALESTNADARVRLWDLYRRMNRLQEAQEVIADFQSWTTDRNAAFQLGLHHYEKRDYRQALEQMELVLSAQPDDTQILAFVAGLCQLLREEGKALETLDRLLALSPGLHEARVQLGVLLRNAGRAEQALAQFREVITNAPGYGEAYVQEALTLAGTGKTDEGLGVLDRGLALLGSQARLLFYRGLLLDRKGEMARAERDYREVLRLDPQQAGAGNALGYLYARQGVRLDEAVGLIARALDAEPGNAGYLDSLGWAYFRQGKSDESLALLRLALEKRAGDPLILEHLGAVCRSLGDADRTQKCLEGSTARPSPSGLSSGP